MDGRIVAPSVSQDAEREFDEFLISENSSSVGNSGGPTTNSNSIGVVSNCVVSSFDGNRLPAGASAAGVADGSTEVNRRSFGFALD